MTSGEQMGTWEVSPPVAKGFADVVKVGPSGGLSELSVGPDGVTGEERGRPGGDGRTDG